MNRIIKLISGIGLLQFCLLITANAQDAGNFSGTVLDLSRTYPGGTARIQGLGGAQTALGGDISSASSNPAGLGFFNRSEISFSPTLNFVNSTSDYLGVSTNDSKLNLNFANLGAVINKTRSGLIDSKWRGGSFGISINRIADFQNQITYEGNSFNPTDPGNPDRFILDPERPADFIQSAVLNSYFNNQGNINFDSDLAELAYEAYLTGIFDDETGASFIDRDIYAVDNNGNLLLDENGAIIPAYPEEGAPTRQSEEINSTGATYQTSVAYGGNYNDQIYIGASLGIVSVNRDVERIYTEEPTLATLQRLTLTDNYNINGVGINATVGVIARPLTALLIGLSYTTPTTYGLEQTQETVLRADYLQATDFRGATEEFGLNYTPFSYNVTTPGRLKAGVTYFFGKNGFITGDVERVNYGGAKIKNGSDNVSFNGDNQVINRFESVFNYRVGAEYRFKKYRIRAGYSYMEDPTRESFDRDNVGYTYSSESFVSVGAGIRTRDMFFDVGLVNSLGKNSTISPYPGAPIAEIANKNTTATFSVGFFF